ncbi:hypothetical protein [Plantactinospora sp. KLBMP9567]|uniref:hypothetical protein n=1 Tax=Plantactinospora sp. KLBMP9567 TaxID=3085900 RepID=UPI00298281F4|nr:hypothetical protein [Plantactinospora sp. KLBMP9567]MDW5323835.1 hypothetical protein [Plantactinospora sp. KLBMP9567]
MRRVLSMVLVAFGVLGLTLGLVGVSLGFGAVAASAAAGKKVCTVTDERMTELSGMIATSSGYVMINDGSEDPDRERVFLLDTKCKLKKAVQYASNPRDPEDLALSPDGKTLWIADTGDNDTERRTSVVLWSMPLSGATKPVLHRLTFPGNKRHDAEALLIGSDNVPLIITKATGKAEIYRPSAALKKNNDEGVPLAKAGEISLPKSSTANPFGGAGRVTITGAARSPDGSRVALRTYADAFEWDVKDDDLVKTLTTGKPRMTALADPFGEAVAYTPDGKSFLTVSDVASLDEELDVTVLSYTPAKEVAASAGGSGADPTKSATSWTDSLTLDDITYLIAAVGVLGALLVGLGIFGIVRARRRPKEDGLGAVGPDGDDIDPRAGREEMPGGDRDRPGGRRPDYDDGSNWGPARSGGYDNGYRSDRPADDYEPAGRGRPAGGVYGGKPADGSAVYGAKPAGGGGVYGGGRPPGGGGGGRPQGGGGRPQGGGGGRPPAGGGVYGGAPAGGGVPAGRPRAGGGGVYGGQPSGGNGNGRAGRPGPDDQWGGAPRSGQGAGPRAGGPRGGQYGQPRQRSGGHPDDYHHR